MRGMVLITGPRQWMGDRIPGDVGALRRFLPIDLALQLRLVDFMRTA